MESHWHQLIRDVERMHHVLKRIVQRMDQMAIDLTALTTAVASEKTVDDSVVALLKVLSDQIAALSAGTTDPTTQAALDALVGQMQTQATTLAAAVTANTPASPVPAAAKRS